MEGLIGGLGELAGRDRSKVLGRCFRLWVGWDFKSFFFFTLLFGYMVL